MKNIRLTSLLVFGVLLACLGLTAPAVSASPASENHDSLNLHALAVVPPSFLLAQVNPGDVALETQPAVAAATEAEADSLSTQVSETSDTSLPPGIQEFLTKILVKYPWIAAIVAAAGGLRVFAKPAFSLIALIIARTKTQWDDGVLASIVKFFDTKYGRWLRYIINWLFSVNIKAPAKV